MLILLILLQISLNIVYASDFDVIVVRNDLAYDYTLAQAYAYKYKVPIVSTSSNELDKTAEELLIGYKELGYERVAIIGGYNAISFSVQQKLENMGFITNRFSEVDRYSTSAAIAMFMFGKADNAVLVNGESQKALLLAQRIAINLEAPILYIKKNKIPDSVLYALNFIEARNVYVIDYEINGNIYNELKGFNVYKVKSLNDISQKGTDEILVFVLFMVPFILLLIYALYGKIVKKKEEIILEILTEDEEKVVKVIMEHGGSIRQDKLPELTNFSKPKISRILSSLAERGIIEKKPYKKTQIVYLKRNFRKKG